MKESLVLPKKGLKNGEEHLSTSWKKWQCRGGVEKEVEPFINILVKKTSDHVVRLVQTSDTKYDVLKFFPTTFVIGTLTRIYVDRN